MNLILTIGNLFCFRQGQTLRTWPGKRLFWIAEKIERDFDFGDISRKSPYLKFDPDGLGMNLITYVKRHIFGFWVNVFGCRRFNSGILR